jgi:uncharacterized protein (DUF2342 family)
MSNLLSRKIDNNLSKECPQLELQNLQENSEQIYEHVQDYLETEVALINPQFVSQNKFSSVIKDLADDFYKFRKSNQELSSKQNLSFSGKLVNKHSYLEKPLQKTAQGWKAVNNSKDQLLISAIANLMSKNVLGLCSQLYYQRSPVELFIINENVIKISSKLELDQQQFIKWILVHEITHVVQMTANDHFYHFIRQKIIDLNSNAVQDKKEVINSMVAAMTYIEGMADHVMDVPGIVTQPEIDIMRTKVDYRRNNPPFYLGLILRLITNNKNQQYIKGKIFADQIVKRCGQKILMLPLQNTEFLPSQDEIDNPQLWIKRCIASS